MNLTQGYLAGCLFCEKTNYGTVEETIAWYMAHMIIKHWEIVQQMRDNPQALEDALKNDGIIP